MQNLTCRFVIVWALPTLWAVVQAIRTHADAEHHEAYAYADATEPLLRRKWIDGPDHATATEPGLVVMQFNILADGPAQEQFKRKVKKLGEHLKWKRRFQRVLDEVVRVDPDLLMMEEVNHYEDFWKSKLQSIGYDGIFLPKFSKDYKEPNTRPPPYFGGKPSDGCLLFVKVRKLKLGRTRTRRFAKVLSPSMSQGVVMAEIQDAVTNSYLFTASVSHLKAGDTRNDIFKRKQQCDSWINMLEDFHGPPYVIAGDMNENVKKDKFVAVRRLKRRLHLKSVYPRIKYTAINGNWRSILDYIFVSDEFQVRSLWSIPDLPDDSLPSAKYPSDHLAIASRIVLGKNGSKDRMGSKGNSGNEDKSGDRTETRHSGERAQGLHGVERGSRGDNRPRGRSMDKDSGPRRGSKDQGSEDTSGDRTEKRHSGERARSPHGVERSSRGDSRPRGRSMDKDSGARRDRKNQACDNIRSPFMIKKNEFCETYTWGIENRCNKDIGWTKNKFCQQSCYDSGFGYDGDTCQSRKERSDNMDKASGHREDSGDSRSSSPSRGSRGDAGSRGNNEHKDTGSRGDGEDRDCDNIQSPFMMAKNESCETYAWGIENRCNKDPGWTKNKFCQQSCYDAGFGYDGDSCKARK